jgi:hypothetical protein
MPLYLKQPEEKVFWVTNISQRNVTLSDLYISIPAMASVNLLDQKHYHFTEEQLLSSQKSGSLFRKQHLLAVRKFPPQMIPMAEIVIDPNAVIPTRTISTYEIKQQYYEELDIKDENSLIENSDVINKPIIGSKDK